ncbi:MAG: rhodanese-like domain-containing protein [Ardenticatenales bacterium]|nr:rhodanese-like domain-containing protein [Ardenticatenales bacterium]
MASSDQTPIEITHISPQTLHEQLQAGDEAVLLDVRMPWDHEAQHPAGAISLPLNELPQRIAELDPTKRYVLSCYHGYSSQDGVAFLMQQGFERVENLEGGFSGWAVAGLPVAGKHTG